MRNKREITEYSEVAFSLADAQRLIQELTARLEKLEQQSSPVIDGKAQLPSVTVETSNKKRGPRKRVPTPELLERRKNLNTWLEQNWPFLSVALRKANYSHEALTAINAAKEHIPGVFQPDFYRSTEKYEEPLWTFLRSGRFHGNPRNLAAAMAGLPELSWKRSFDICSHYPYRGGIATEAYWDYMRRNFPDRLRELAEVRTTEQVRLVLARSRTKDSIYLRLKAHPDKALEWLSRGKPSQT